MRIEQTVTIDRLPQEVFAYVTDPDKLATWQTTTVAVERDSSGPFTVGERFSEVHAAMGRKIRSSFEVAVHDPPRAFGLRALDGPLRLDGHWTFEPDGDATRVRFVGEGAVHGPMRALSGVLRRSIDRRFRGYHARLKALLES